VAEFIAFAKANPGKVTVASAGVGSAPHLFAALFKSMAGVDFVIVNYHGWTGAAGSHWWSSPGHV